MTPTQGPRPSPKASAANAAVERLKSVKTAWDKAADGAKKVLALKHFEAAEKAHASRDDANCIKECKAAEQALA